MAFITRNFLDSFYNRLSLSERQAFTNRSIALAESAKSPGRRSIFLSHSHKDSDLVEKVAFFLMSQGHSVYVDWKDSSMPPATNAQTANNIRVRIRRCDEFIVLASNNALDSKWVPWELGFADGAIGVPKISIFPVADNNGAWNGSEYFGLYKRVELGHRPGIIENKAIIKEPATSTGLSIKQLFGQEVDRAIYYS